MTTFVKKSKRELSQRRLENYDRYCKIIQWGRQEPIKFASRIMGLELLDIQKYAIYNSWYKDFVLWLESRNAGKALALDTPIPTPNGFKQMGEIKEFDYVFDENGNPTRVIYASDVFLNHDCYKLVFDDGETLVADAEHLWQIHSPTNTELKIYNSEYIYEHFNNQSVPIYGRTEHKPIDYKRIIDIVRVNSVPTKCIQVENPSKLYLCGNKGTVTHNTTKLAIYPMIRSLLIPNHVTYYIGNTGEQAKETFKKMEKIAKREIESFVGSTEVFWEEIKRNGATSDGFVHNPSSFKTELFNNSEIYTLNSDIINIKGKRANLVAYDEAGWFSTELFVQTEQFVNQDENFKLGGGIDIALEPQGFPRQLLYASSASDTDSDFYKKYKQFSERMIMGDPKYFVCDFNVDVVLNATYNGDPYPPLISRDKVTQALADNREKALRELWNKFSADSHEGQILSRREVLQHTKLRTPLLTNDTGNRLFGMSWDSARINDNSVICVAEFIQDPERGWCMDLHNVISLVDVDTHNKTPLRIPEQVEEFKRILLNYNGSHLQKLDYENIKVLVFDSGSGGQIIGGVSDYMLNDWMGDDGKLHRGLIDKSHKANETAKLKFPNAVDIVELIDPKGRRNDIFDSISRMVKLGVVTFPADYDGSDYLMYVDDEGNEVQQDITEEERLAFVQIELLKNEIVKMCKYTDKGNVHYNYPPDRRGDSDDRVFAFGLLCLHLAKLRRGEIVTTNYLVEDLSSLFAFKSPKIK